MQIKFVAPLVEGILFLVDPKNCLSATMQLTENLKFNSINKYQSVDMLPASCVRVRDDELTVCRVVIPEVVTITDE
jgi:hypothetical protein